MELDIKSILTEMLNEGASDLHVAVGISPNIRINGKLSPMDLPKLSPTDTKDLVYSILNEDQIREFETQKELDMSFGVKGLSRFRVNVYRDRGSVAAAIRTIPFEIKSFDELGLPPIVESFADIPNGLVLICGPTGSGKSTTLAALIQKINQSRNGHIITVEDPIEFIHRHGTCVVNQREVNADTVSFSAALKRVLRQDPDIILIGEMRDIETIQAALTAGETGHLVFATLHTNDATQTINRIIDVFPSSQQAQVRTLLSFVVQGIMVQQLIPKVTGDGRALCLEVLIPTPAIRSLIREGKEHQIYSLISTGGQYGMQTMNQSLARLYKRNLITHDEAMNRSSNPDDLERILAQM